MAYAVPDVLDPIGDYCFRVYCPADPAYRRALFAAVSYLCNWYAWQRDDAHGGAIAAARWRESYTKTVDDLLAGEGCNGGEPPAPEVITEIETIYIGGGADGGCEDMPCLDLTNLIRWNNGVLEVRNSCCEWEIVEGDSSGAPPSQEVLPDDIVPTEPVPENLACRKAAYMAGKLAEIAEVGFDNSVNTVWGWISNMRDAYPEYEMSKWRLYYAFQAGGVMGWLSALSWGNLWTGVNTDTLTCRWADVLSADSLEVTEDEFDDMKGELKHITAFLTEKYLEELMNAIGRSGFSWMATEAQAIDDDCICPDAVWPPSGFSDGMTWTYTMDFSALSALPANVEHVNPNGYLWVGHGLVAHPVATGHATNVGVDHLFPSAGPASTILKCAVKWSVVGDETYHSSNTYLGAGTTGTGCIDENDLALISGNDPASAGEFTCVKTVSGSLGATDRLHSVSFCEHDNEDMEDDPRMSNVIIKVAYAGSGVDPFV